MKSNDVLKKSIRKNAFILALFAMASTALVSIVHQLTKDKIASEVERVMNQRLNKLVPLESYNNSPTSDCLLLNNHSRINQVSINKVHRMRKDNQPIALVFSSTAHDGYSGDINLLIAISHQDRLLGVEVLNHRETPGLGDKIDSNKSHWLQQFDNLDLSRLELSSLESKSLNKNKWRVKKDGGDFDALTGATITPRSTIKVIYQTTQYFTENKTLLFNRKANCEIKPRN